MSNKTRSGLKLLAIIIVAFMVLLHLDIVVIKPLLQYKFWLTVFSFGLLLISSK